MFSTHFVLKKYPKNDFTTNYINPFYFLKKNIYFYFTCMSACMCLCALCARGGQKVPLDTLEPPGSLQKQRAASALTPGVTFPALISTHFVENDRRQTIHLKHSGQTRGSAQIPRTLAVLLLLKAVTSQHHKPSQHQVQSHPWHTEFKTSLSCTSCTRLLSQDT